MEKNQHLRISTEILRNRELSNNDIGVYLAIGKYMNKDTKEAFPSQTTDTGLSLQTVRNCIKKLHAAKAFDIRKEGRKNIYIFSQDETFEMFDHNFIDKSDLTSSEKGFVAKIQPYMLKNETDGVIKYTYSELSEMTGLSVSTIMRNNKTLQNKDFAEITIDKKVYHLDKLGQFVVCALFKHEEDINELKAENKMMKEKIAALEKAILNKEATTIIL